MLFLRPLRLLYPFHDKPGICCLGCGYDFTFRPPSSSTSINSLHTADLICNTRLSTGRRLFVRIPTARYLSILDEYPTVPTSNNRGRPTAHPSIDPSAIRRTNTRKGGRRVLHLHLHLKTHSTEYTPLLRNTKKLPQDQTTQTALALRGQTIQRPTRLFALHLTQNDTESFP